MATVSLAAHRNIKELAREMEGVSRAVATFSLTAELALARRDWLAAYEAAETVEALMVRFTELRRGLLVAGAR